MTGNLKILIIGGYGTFGGRIVELLESEARLTLLIGGRSQSRAIAYCRNRRDPRALLIPTVFDRDGDLHRQLRTLRPDILVDASGPFQAYAERAFGVIEACIAERINYLDLADGSEFVGGVPSFDDAARAAGIYCLTGVSTYPVLNAAVVRSLSSCMGSIDKIHSGIAPSPFAGVGENVIRAIASYAGQPVAVMRDGKVTNSFPFTEPKRFTIAPPGYLPLRSTLFSLVDVPDLRLFPQLWPDVRDIWVGAGPVPEVLHRVLIAFAWLVRLRWVRSLSPLARLMHVVTNHLRWGEHRGGMFVAVEGEDGAGKPIRRSWHMIAAGDDGPLIPSMAVKALVSRVLDGRTPPPGARTAVNDLDLKDYEALFAHRRIVIGTRTEVSTPTSPLHARLLGSAWDKLPCKIRDLHDLGNKAAASGRATVERGRGVLAGLIAGILGFPTAADDTPVSIRFEVSGGTETWIRTFGRKSFRSRVFAGSGRSASLLCESFGPLVFALALVLDGDRLVLILRRWSAFGVPLPMFLSPRVTAYESAENGRFHFYVELGHRFTGLIVRYSGWLIPEP
jgi:hypothetical protein